MQGQSSFFSGMICRFAFQLFSFIHWLAGMQNLFRGMIDPVCASRFTNDGEVLESGRHASFRLQPKLHFDVEVD